MFFYSPFCFFLFFLKNLKNGEDKVAEGAGGRGKRAKIIAILFVCLMLAAVFSGAASSSKIQEEKETLTNNDIAVPRIDKIADNGIDDDGNGYIDDVRGWGSATYANFDYWMETFSIQAGDLKKVIIDKTFFQDDEVYPFNQTEIIYGLTLSGSIQLNGDTSLIRVILVDNDFNEYLVYEAYPLIVTSNSFSVTNVCEETCLLESITPYSLKIEVIDASIHIDELSYSDSIIRGIIGIAELQKQIKETQNAVKIKEINNQIKKKGLKWIAGETSVSKLFHEEKKKLFSRDKVPNLQGAEYYKGGILEIKSGDTSPSLSTDSGSSSLIESFDWRNRHGANNPDSPYYDGDPNGSGWITPVKSQGCNHCWAFTPLHATEAIVNLYFNQHLDLDLSEQDVASCSGGNIGCCQGGYIGTALNYIINTGVVDEECFPYSASCESCANKCSNPNEQIKISGRLYPGYDEEDIKRAIIDYGPITGGISSWWHFMVMVGFDKDPDDGENIWIFKNSWGTGWGDNGYGYLKVELTDLYGKNALLTPVTSFVTPYEIACYDKDGDGYYNWGISENKPPSCPGGCPAEKDGDDSNPCLGPLDSDGYCIVLCLAPNITSYAPESPVNDTVCNWKTFSVTVNQTVNVSWYLNDSLLFTNVSVTEAKCTLHAEIVGEHNVSAVASNANGTAIQTWIWNVLDTEPPIANFTYSPENPVVNQTVTFNASSSYDPDGNITNYEWDFGDGTNGTGEMVNHSYSSTGNYTVILTITDDAGAKNSTNKTIAISKPTTVKVEPTSQTVSPGQSFSVNVTVENVTDLASDGAILHFDPNAMQATNVTGGVIDTFPIEIMDNTTGTVTFAYALSAGSFSGNGTLATIEFTTNASAEGTFNLNLTGVELLRPDHSVIPTDVFNGTVTLIPFNITITSPENRTYASKCVRLNFTVEPEGTALAWIGYSLDGGANVTIAGNTTVGGLSEGSHNITVFANDTHGNMAASNTVFFTLHPADIDFSGRVYVSDLLLLAQAYNSKPGDGNWNPDADLNCDDRVYTADLLILAQNYNKVY